MPTVAQELRLLTWSLNKLIEVLIAQQENPALARELQVLAKTIEEEREKMKTDILGGIL